MRVLELDLRLPLKQFKSYEDARARAAEACKKARVGFNFLLVDGFIRKLLKKARADPVLSRMEVEEFLQEAVNNIEERDYVLVVHGHQEEVAEAVFERIQRRIAAKLMLDQLFDLVTSGARKYALDPLELVKKLENRVKEAFKEASELKELSKTLKSKGVTLQDFIDEIRATRER